MVTVTIVAAAATLPLAEGIALGRSWLCWVGAALALPAWVIVLMFLASCWRSRSSSVQQIRSDRSGIVK
jgi:hypothetical protein